MALRAKATVDNTGIVLYGSGLFKDDVTFLQDATRVAALAPFTVMAQQASTKKWVPLTDVDPTLTSASLECGVNGGALAAYQVADAEFAIEIDGTLTDVQVDMTAIAALTDIAPAINTILIPLGAICTYNEETNTFYFASLTQGLPKSSISVLTAVSGGTGTDISGATHLNGLTAVGTVTAATGGDGEDIPLGIYWGSEIAAASLVSADVTNRKVLVGGSNYVLDEDSIVLENSLDLDDIVTASGKTIRQHLEALGIFTRDTYTNGQVAPI